MFCRGFNNSSTSLLQSNKDLRWFCKLGNIFEKLLIPTDNDYFQREINGLKDIEDVPFFFMLIGDGRKITYSGSSYGGGPIIL